MISHQRGALSICHTDGNYVVELSLGSHLIGSSGNEVGKRKGNYTVDINRYLNGYRVISGNCAVKLDGLLYEYGVTLVKRDNSLEAGVLKDENRTSSTRSALLVITRG